MKLNIWKISYFFAKVNQSVFEPKPFG